MKESGVLKNTSLVFGQMNEPPGARLRVGLTGLTIAESFRDEGADVLLFIDNIFRFTQAGSEVSALLGRSEEHTSELLSLTNLVCRLLLEKKKPRSTSTTIHCAAFRERPQ